MPREADSLEDYQIHGTYQPKNEETAVEAAEGILKDVAGAALGIVKEHERKDAEAKRRKNPGNAASLDEAIIWLSEQGYEVTMRTEKSAQLVQRKRFGWWKVLGASVVSLGLLTLPVALQQAAKRDKVIFLFLDDSGQVQVA